MYTTRGCRISGRTARRRYPSGGAYDGEYSAWATVDKRNADIGSNVLLLSTFCRLSWYGAMSRLPNESMMAACYEYSALVWVTTAIIEEWSGLAILRLTRYIEIDTVLTLVAVAHVAEVDKSALPDQLRFPYGYAQRMLMFRLRSNRHTSQPKVLL